MLKHISSRELAVVIISAAYVLGYFIYLILTNSIKKGDKENGNNN